MVETYPDAQPGAQSITQTRLDERRAGPLRRLSHECYQCARSHLVYSLRPSRRKEPVGLLHEHRAEIVTLITLEVFKRVIYLDRRGFKRKQLVAQIALLHFHIVFIDLALRAYFSSEYKIHDHYNIAICFDRQHVFLQLSRRRICTWVALCYRNNLLTLRHHQCASLFRDARFASLAKSDRRFMAYLYDDF